MIRLVLLLATPATIAGSVLLTILLEWVLGVISGMEDDLSEEEEQPKRKKIIVRGGGVMDIANRKYKGNNNFVFTKLEKKNRPERMEDTE